MIKNLSAALLIAALTLSVSAEKQTLKVDFEQMKLEASGRNARHVVSTANEPTETFTYLFGKAKLVDGKSGTGLDMSDTRTRTELRLKTGHFYDVNQGTISFWISPKKKNFGVDKETAIFEETNGDTILGLYIDDSGRMKIKASAKFPLDEEEKEIDYEAIITGKDKKPPVKFDGRDEIEKSLADKKANEEAAKVAKEAASKPTFQVKEYKFHSFQLGDTTNWNVGEWNHVALTWDLRRGFFALLVNGKYAIRSFASDGNSLGIFLDRGIAGKYIKFGPGNNGFSAVIDNIIVSKTVTDKEFDVK